MRAKASRLAPSFLGLTHGPHYVSDDVGRGQLTRRGTSRSPRGEEDPTVAGREALRADGAVHRRRAPPARPVREAPGPARRLGHAAPAARSPSQSAPPVPAPRRSGPAAAVGDRDLEPSSRLPADDPGRRQRPGPGHRVPRALGTIGETLAALERGRRLVRQLASGGARRRPHGTGGVRVGRASNRARSGATGRRTPGAGEHRFQWPASVALPVASCCYLTACQIARNLRPNRAIENKLPGRWTAT